MLAQIEQQAAVESVEVDRRGELLRVGVEGADDIAAVVARLYELGFAAERYLDSAADRQWYRADNVGELSREEAAQYWLELLEAGRRLERALEPVKLNYETLGNSLPHLHTHVMPRYADDPKPGWPFPHPEGDRGLQDEEEFRRDLELLRG